MQYGRAPPTTSWRGLRMRLAKLNFTKILPQYKGRAIGKNFILRIFCHIQYKSFEQSVNEDTTSVATQMYQFMVRGLFIKLMHSIPLMV